MSRGDFQKAIADFTREIESAPREDMGYNNRGIARQNVGDLAGAVADYTKAIELSPHTAYLYGNRAIALTLAGRDAEARRDVDKCLQLNPSVREWIESRIKWAEERRARR